MTIFNNVEELIHFIETSKRVTPKQDLSKMEYYLNDLGNGHIQSLIFAAVFLITSCPNVAVTLLGVASSTNLLTFR